MFKNKNNEDIATSESFKTAIWTTSTYLQNLDLPNSHPHQEQQKEVKIKVYKRRWLMLLLFSLFAMSNVMQYMQYSIIADVVVEYYNIETIVVDWSAMVYMVFYVLFSFPGNYILDRFGLRITILIGMIGTCVGAWIKVFSVHPDSFYIALIGQIVCAFFQVFVLPIPPQLAATWFSEKEVSTACGIGVIGTQAGAAIGFLIPPLLVPSGDQEQVGKDLFTNVLSVAVFCTILVPLIFFGFDNAPPVPPSTAQQKLASAKSVPFLKSVQNLFSNRSYFVFLIIYGVNIGAFYPFSVLANQIVLYYYPDVGAEIGILGLTVICSSLIGSLVSGIVLDKLKKFRATTSVVHALYLITLIIFSVFINKGMIMMHIILPIVGFFMGAVLSIGFELGVELTYPEPEGISGGLLTTSAQLFALVFTYLYSFIFNNYGNCWSNLFICAAILVADILFIFVKFHLKRQAVQETEF